MAYTFTTQQINNIQTAVDNIGDNDNWYLAYEAVATALEEALADTGDSPDVPYVSAEDRAYVDAVHVWFKGALLVNSGEGAFSSLIRNYTLRQKQLHLGLSHTEESVAGIMQTSSN